MRIGTYAAIERIDFIREGKKFTLEQYMRRFEISRRTAFRDFEFIRTYRRKPLYLKYKNGVYQFSTFENTPQKKP